MRLPVALFATLVALVFSGCTTLDAARTGLSICGDGKIERDESCDDGNTINADGCSAICAVEVLPVLLIDETGRIVEAVDITVNGGLGQGDSIAGSTITVDEMSASAEAVAIAITNRSDAELRVHHLVSTSASSTKLTITNEGPSNIVVAGLIDNPSGHTSIRSAHGDVRATAGATIRSNSLAIEADAIASEDNRLSVELGGSPNAETVLNIATHDDAFLDLGADQRDSAASETVLAARVTATDGDVDFLLRPALLSGAPTETTWAFEELAAANVALRSDPLRAGGPMLNVVAHSDLFADGVIDVLTNGEIHVIETNGDLPVGVIESSGRDVALESTGGSIRARSAQVADQSARVIGSSITLRAEQGAVGTVSDWFAIDSSHAASGTVDIAAHHGVFVTEVVGDLNLGAVVSRTSDAIVATREGSILDGSVDPQADIQAANIDLVAEGGGIGTAQHGVDIYGAGHSQAYNSLAIDLHDPGAGRLVARARDGVYLDQVDGAVHVLQVISEVGAVRLAVTDSTLQTNHLELLESGQTQSGTAITFGLVYAPLAVELFAGDEISVPASAAIESGASIFVGGDTDWDDAGMTIDIRGDLRAPSVEISGGDDADFLQLGNPSGINAGGTTVVRGNGGVDRFFVRATAGSTTLLGDSGSDLFYIASNATKSLFTSAGYYQDVNPGFGWGSQLGLLSGDLSAMKGLVIDTGTVENGIADEIHISADSALVNLSGTLDSGTLSGLGIVGEIHYTAGPLTWLMLELGSGDDTLLVDDPSPTKAIIHGGAGNDNILGCTLPHCELVAD